MYVPEGFEPMDMPYQDRQGGVTDPFGNIWWISTRLAAESFLQDTRQCRR
jgi:hypothetical protein